MEAGVNSRMIESGIQTLPNPNKFVAANTNRTTGTDQMAEFPDYESDDGTNDVRNDDGNATAEGGKTSDPAGNSYDTTSDKQGFLLFQHDRVGENSAAATVNYVSTSTSIYCYLAASDGAITQYDTAGTQFTP